MSDIFKNHLNESANATFLTSLLSWYKVKNAWRELRSLESDAFSSYIPNSGFILQDWTNYVYESASSSSFHANYKDFTLR